MESPAAHAESAEMAAEPHPAKMHAAGGMHFGGGGMHFGGVEA
jgi:hypothetical protein